MISFGGTPYHSRIGLRNEPPTHEFLHVKLRDGTLSEADCNAARTSKYCVSGIAAAFVSAGAWAQVPKTAKQKPGGLDGKVVNAKGAPVAGAQILWQAADGETPHVLHSDAQGQFHIESLRSGLYEFARFRERHVVRVGA